MLKLYGKYICWATRENLTIRSFVDDLRLEAIGTECQAPQLVQMVYYIKVGLARDCKFTISSKTILIVSNAKLRQLAVEDRQSKRFNSNSGHSQRLGSGHHN